jgi:hypothetical protein
LIALGISDVTYLMESHAWLAMFAKARRPRTRVAQGTVAESAVVSVVVVSNSPLSAVASEGIPAAQTNKQTNKH